MSNALELAFEIAKQEERDLTLLYAHRHGGFALEGSEICTDRHGDSNLAAKEYLLKYVERLTGELDKHTRNLNRVHALRQKIFSEFPMLAVK